MAAMNKCLAKSNKSRTGTKETKKRNRQRLHLRRSAARGGLECSAPTKEFEHDDDMGTSALVDSAAPGRNSRAAERVIRGVAWPNESSHGEVWGIQTENMLSLLPLSHPISRRVYNDTHSP